MVRRALAPRSSALGDPESANFLISTWRSQGMQAAQQLQVHLLQANPLLRSDGLQQELSARLAGHSGPRLLVDGVWFSRPVGGITRVWEQVLSCWQLPGLLTPQAPVTLIDRDSHLAISEAFPTEQGELVDPLDPEAVAALAQENASIAERVSADVFLSSWISSCGSPQPQRPELALVHDCLPERFQAPEVLRQVRRRWLTGAQCLLGVSAATASDLEILLSKPVGSVPWCHSAPALVFAETVEDLGAPALWARLKTKAGLRDSFVLLPATSRIGTYKNPELVAEALGAEGLESVQLVLTGVGAQQRLQELEAYAPHLVGRGLAAGFTDLELALAYRHALAVVIPSRIEGFGLPALEALAAGGVVLVADSRGLQEAGAGACLRFARSEPKQLAALLQMLLDSPGSAWLCPALERRRQERLAGLNPDLLGLALLTMARSLIR